MGITRIDDMQKIFIWRVGVGVYAIICVVLKDVIVVRYGIFIIMSLVLLKVKFRDLLEMVQGLR